MTTREIYSTITTLAALGAAWLVAGTLGVVVFIAGMLFSHVDVTWIEPEAGDFDEAE